MVANSPSSSSDGIGIAPREVLRFYRAMADNSLWKIVKDTTSGEVTTLVFTDSDA
jgi:hypothetical protein